MKRIQKFLMMSMVLMFCFFGIQGVSLAATNLDLQIKNSYLYQIDPVEFDKLVNQLVTNLKPANYQTIESYLATDINKDNRVDIAVAYKYTNPSTKKTKSLLKVFKWDPNKVKFVQAYSKQIDNITVNGIIADSLVYTKYSQFVFSYSYYPDIKGAVMVGYDNGVVKQMYNGKSNGYGFKDIDNDGKLEFSIIVYDKKDRTKATRTWKKWDGKDFKTIKTESTTVKQIEDEIAEEAVKVLQQLQKDAYDQKMKETVVSLKPTDFDTIEGYTFEDADNDGVAELIAVFSKKGVSTATKTVKIGVYRLDKNSNKMVEAYNKQLQGIKVTVALVADVIYGGNKEFIMVYSDTQNKQNLIVLSYDDNATKEAYTVKADNFYAYDIDNDSRLELAKVDYLDSTKQNITWLKWDGTGFVTLKEETTSRN